MKKILHIIDSMGMGGIQTFIMSIYRNIDRSAFGFDFLTFREGDPAFEKEIADLGGTIRRIPGRGKGLFAYRRALRNFFAEHPEYGTVHYHVSSLSDIEPIKAACRAGVPVRIVHSHSTSAPGRSIHRVLHTLHKCTVGRYATDFYACSEEAAAVTYGGTRAGKKSRVIPCGIDCGAFRFSEENRQKIRSGYGIGDGFLLGLTGRYTENKNQLFALDILDCFIKKYPGRDARLILVGDGPLRDRIAERADELGLGGRVILTGFRNDIPELLSAMDLLLFPSHYEGFGIAAVEAQASGLPCLISDTVPRSVAVKKNAVFMPLEAGAEAWADASAGMSGRDCNVQPIIDAGLGIGTSVSMLCGRYKDSR